MRYYPLEARARIRALGASKVREVANAGFGQAGILRFWFGESDQPTPAYVREAAEQALRDGRTFYSHNQGIAPLRAAIAAYLTRLHGRPFASAQVSVTSSGVSALMLAMQALLDPGDRVVAVTPVWPNVTEIPRILGAEVVRVGLEARDGRWQLDLGRLLEAITPATRLLLVNSPGNPTGWVLSAADRDSILEHCRRLGVWVLTDDVYERLVFGANGALPPSILQAADPSDRVVGANSFSKAWLMTGWRLGWIVAPSSMEADLGKLIEFNTSCAPEFVQAGGLAAIEQGEPYVERLRNDLAAKRDRVVSRLRGLPGVEAPMPEGGMYAFFSIAGHGDSVALAKRLLQEARLGLAPGAAFGPEGEGWLRWCFAAEDSALEEGLGRLESWLHTPSVAPSRGRP
ncbi:MAG TPA: pyridoxal phosphate-dependent aminotransferase [Steroidobacteraceae bacterium]|nr:pyridoxal phosphate-dependent aminotransferase [Steroidobacteraceae bacterium]